MKTLLQKNQQKQNYKSSRLRRKSFAPVDVNNINNVDVILLIKYNYTFRTCNMFVHLVCDILLFLQK